MKGIGFSKRRNVAVPHNSMTRDLGIINHDSPVKLLQSLVLCLGIRRGVSALAQSQSKNRCKLSAVKMGHV